jgi:hypothetical protein
MDQINDGYPDVPPDKFPLAPLEAIARQKWQPADEDRVWSDRAFGAMVGKPGRTIGRWRLNGYIPWDSADVAAVALGLHPMSVWPERWMALDRGLIEGTDARAMREFDAAIEKVGQVIEARQPAVNA